MTLAYKKCPMCFKEKPLGDYYKPKDHRKAQSYCKPCMKKYNSNRTKILKQRKGRSWY